MKRANTSNFLTFANMTICCLLMNVGDESFNSFVHSSFVILLFYEIKHFLKKSDNTIGSKESIPQG
jgi:hypothetical protein